MRCLEGHDVVTERVRVDLDDPEPPVLAQWVGRCCHGITSQGDTREHAIDMTLEACALAHELPLVPTSRTCAHRDGSVHAIGNACHEDEGRHGPLLLWCQRCGSLAWSDGTRLLIYTTADRPPAWLYTTEGKR